MFYYVEKSPDSTISNHPTMLVTLKYYFRAEVSFTPVQNENINILTGP